MIETHPALFLLLGALLIPLLKEGRGKDVYLVALPLLSLYNMLMLPHGSYYQWEFLGFTIEPLRVDSLAVVFATIFHIAAALGMCFSLSLKSNLERTFAMLYAGAAVGTVFAGDLLSMFLFWETLTVTAAVIIWCRRTSGSQGAGFRYMLFHAMGGLILLAGIVLHIHDTGSIAFEYIGLDSTASWLIFIGFGINAAWPGLHAWLTDAYPEAGYAGAVFLSAFTTKSAVYALARGFPGTELLIWIGVVMAVFPMFYGIIENDLRRVISYSIINKIGFMMVGIGIGTELAINGACAYAFAHILYKGLLFMALGAVLFRTGKTKVTELGGLYRTMPWTAVFCIVGAAALSAVPFLVGFPTKAMITSAAGKEHLALAWFALLFSSAGAMLYAGIKVPYYAFFGKDSGLRPPEAPRHMLVAMGAASLVILGLGIWPQPLYDLLPFPTDYEAYTASHIVTQFELLLFAAGGFALMAMAGVLPAQTRSVNLDVDYFYRRIGRGVLWFLDKFFNGLNKLSSELIVDRATGAVMRAFTNTPYKLARAAMVPYWSLLDDEEREKKKRALTRSFETNSSPVGITGLLAAALVSFLILYMFIN